jgi:hypothetical protein
MAKGKYFVECRDKNGKLKWKEEINNAVTTEGITKLLNIGFGSTSHPKITAWYLGLIDNSPSPSLSAGDTHASHAGWSESVAYSNSTRVQWVTTDLTSGHTTITNASAAAFTINATATIYGIFLSATSTKGSTAASTLYSTAAFGSTQAVANGDTLNITYNASLT